MTRNLVKAIFILGAAFLILALFTHSAHADPLGSWPAIDPEHGVKLEEWFGWEHTVSTWKGSWSYDPWGPKEGLLQWQQRSKTRPVIKTITSQKYHYAKYIKKVIREHFVETTLKHAEGLPVSSSTPTTETGYDYSIFDPPAYLPTTHYYEDPVVIPVPGDLFIYTSWVSYTPDVSGRMAQSYFWTLDGLPLAQDTWLSLNSIGSGRHELYLHVTFLDGSDDDWFFYFNVGKILTLSSTTPSLVEIPAGRSHHFTVSITNTTNSSMPFSLTTTKVAGDGQWDVYYPGGSELFIAGNASLTAEIIIFSPMDVNPESCASFRIVAEGMEWLSNAIDLQINLNGFHWGELQRILSKGK